MPHQLILMRHAKSDHDDPSLSDHDRPLSARGQRDAPRMADWLNKQGRVPELILCSTALRTRETAELMVEQWAGEAVEVVECESLYLSSTESMLWTLGSEHRGKQRVMLLAHNPGVSMMSSTLAERRLSMPTSGITVFDCKDASPGDDGSASPFESLSSRSNLTLTHCITPKELAEETGV